MCACVRVEGYSCRFSGGGGPVGGLCYHLNCFFVCFLVCLFVIHVFSLF